MKTATELPVVAPFDDSPVRTRRLGWPLADSYLGLSVVAGFARGLMWFVGLFMAFALVSGAQKVAKDQMPLWLLVQFIALQIPRIVVFTIPSALLFGTVSTFTEMSSRGEVTALMAGGMSLRRMLRAPLVAAALLAGFAFYLQESIVPKCELRRGQIGASALQSAKASQIFPFISKDEETGNVQSILDAQDFDAKKLSLEKPEVTIFRPDGSKVFIVARSARWDAGRRAWVFEQGTTLRVPPLLSNAKSGLSGLATVRFDEQSFQNDVSLDPTNLSRNTRDLPGQLAAHNFEMVSMRELRFYREEMQAQLKAAQTTAPADLKEQKRLQKEVSSATFGINDKWATPLIVLAMVLIGAPLGVLPQRSASAGLALGLSLMVLLSYYLVWTLVSQWGKSGGPQPMLVAYVPFAILAGLGLFLTWKKS